MLYIGLFIIKFPINTSDKMKADGSSSAGKFKIFVSYYLKFLPVIKWDITIRERSFKHSRYLFEL